jgi:hypothetical protein
MTLRTITLAMRRIAYWTEILINRVHHGAGYTAR